MRSDGSDARNLVGRDGDAETGAADEDGSVGLAVDDHLSSLDGDGRVGSLVLEEGKKKWRLSLIKERTEFSDRAAAHLGVGDTDVDQRRDTFVALEGLDESLLREAETRDASQRGSASV